MRRLIRKLTDWTRWFSVPTSQDAERRMPLSVHRQVARPDVSPSAPGVRAWYEPLDGADNRLVRPYLTAYEREEEARIQRLRRDTLWCATYGVDLDLRDIHARPGVAS